MTELRVTHLYLFLGIETIIFAIDVEIVFRHDVLTYVTQLMNSRGEELFFEEKIVSRLFFFFFFPSEEGEKK